MKAGKVSGGEPGLGGKGGGSRGLGGGGGVVGEAGGRGDDGRLMPVTVAAPLARVDKPAIGRAEREERVVVMVEPQVEGLKVDGEGAIGESVGEAVAGTN